MDTMVSHACAGSIARTVGWMRAPCVGRRAPSRQVGIVSASSPSLQRSCNSRNSVVAKKSYGRTAGVPLGCGANEEEDAGLCYTPCKSGFSGVGPVCWYSCKGTHPSDGGAICCDNASDCTEKIKSLCAGIPIAVAKAILSGGDWHKIVQAA